ncbi:MAG TPA: 2-phospho-L-lactate guanylyltransferase [Acidimicrobiia bacterium]|nr:2-phospho-L-lactate guanylyltransferase [Acidimicrobiia bacterium]
MTVLGAVPVKPFRSAKNRLAKEMTIPQRRLLAEHLGERTLAAVAEAGMEAMVLAADEEVAVWAKSLGYRALLDPGSDLNSAARAAADLAATEGRPWLLIHSDLPLINAPALAQTLAALNSGRPVIAPSPDGGTPLMGWRGVELAFKYGPGSFGRHIRQLAAHQPLVATDFRLMFDIDRPADLAFVLRRDRSLVERLSTLPAS